MPHPTEPTVEGATLTLNDAQRIRLANEIAAVVDEHTADTSELQRQLIIQRRLYELKARRKTWPWPGAANYILPIIRYVVDYYKSRLSQVYRTAGQSLWHGAILGGDEIDEQGRNWRQIAEDFAAVLDYLCLDPHRLDLHAYVDQLSEYLPKDGTAVTKVHWVEGSRQDAVAGKGGRPRAVEVPDPPRAVWDVIDLKRTVWMVGGCDTADMPVFGHWFELTASRLKSWRRQFDLDRDAVTRVLSTPDDPYFVTEERILDEELGVRREDTRVVKTFAVYRIHELRIDFVLDEDDPDAEPVRLMAWWHHASGTLLRVFEPTGAEAFEVSRFLSRGRQFTGTGIAEALRVLNLGGNTLFNQSVDAQTVANCFGFLYKADSTLADFISQAGIHPGIKLPFEGDDPDKEFKPFQLGSGEVVSSSLGLINFILSMADAISKVGGAQQGNVSSGTRVPASVGLSILQESAQMVDSVGARMRDTIIRNGIRTMYLYADHDPAVFDEVLPVDRATQLLAVLRESDALITKRIRVSLNIADSSSNNEKDKQDFVVVLNLLLNVMNMVTEKAASAALPNAPQEYKAVVALSYKTIHEVLSRMLEKFDQFKDPSRILSPELVALFEQMAATPAVPMLPPGGGGGLPRIEGVPGMGAGGAAPPVVGPQ